MMILSPAAVRPKGKCKDIFGIITGKSDPKKKNKKKKKKVSNA